MILFYLTTILVFLGKVFADISVDIVQWSNSILKNLDPLGFFGPRDLTDYRKDKMGVWLHTHFKLPVLWAYYLAHTILVPFIDIWHLANTIRRLGYFLALITVQGLPIYHVLIFEAINQTGFWGFYNYIFHKSSIKYEQFQNTLNK